MGAEVNGKLPGPAVKGNGTGAEVNTIDGVAISIITLVGLLVLWRLSLRIGRGVPDEGAGALGLAAKAAHWAFYAILLVAPVAGLVAWFGASETAGDLHGWVKPVLIVLMSIIGSRTGNPPTCRSCAVSVVYPRISATSAEVPPMSSVTTLSKPATLPAQTRAASSSATSTIVARSMSRRNPRTFAASVGFDVISVSARSSSFSVFFEVSSPCAFPVRYDNCRARCSSAFSGM